MTSLIVTYRFRLKDKHAAALSAKSRAVNFVWNYCNETQQIAVRRGARWLSGFEPNNLTAGSSKSLGLLAETINEICRVYSASRRGRNLPWLRFRSRKALGWVPFKKGTVRPDGQGFIYHGVRYESLHWRDLPKGAIIKSGSFSQDARGQWYINCPVEIPATAKAKPGAVGIDLGLKEIAALSSGEKIENPRHFAKLAEKLATAQRAGKKRQAVKAHAKIKNARRDFLHKLSAQITANHDLIVVGDVSSSKLSRTRMAKSVQDASWSTLKDFLSYKSIRNGGRFLEVNEAWTSRACSSCGAIPDSSPKGIGALGVREWTCDCGTTHDRDVNAAKNILRLGQQALLKEPRECGAVKRRTTVLSQRFRP